MSSLFRCFSGHDERRREVLRERMLREAHERNAEKRRILRNEDLRERYPYQAGPKLATVRQAHPVHKASNNSHSQTSTKRRYLTDRDTIRNPFEGSERESYITRSATAASKDKVRVGMVPARSSVPDPFYVEAQNNAQRKWERAMPDIAVPLSRSYSRTGTSSCQPLNSRGQSRTHTIHRSKSSEAPEVYDPRQDAAVASISRRTHIIQRHNRPPQPVGQRPHGWI